MHAFQVTFALFLFRVIISAIFFIARHEHVTSSFFMHKWNLLRAIIGVLGNVMIFYGFAVIPLSQATALSLTTPIFTTVFSVLMLGDKTNKHLIAAMVIGFAGMLIVVRPWYEFEFHHGAVVTIFAAMCWSLEDVIMRISAVEFHPISQLFYLSIYQTIFSLILAVVFWAPVDFSNNIISITSYSAVGGLCGALGIIVAFIAFNKSGSVSLLSPFYFCALIFSAYHRLFIF